MEFEEYFIDSNDFGFFKSLHDHEKFLFLHDLLCTDYYNIDIPENNSVSSNSLIDTIDFIMDMSINKDTDVNIIQINNSLVFNSECLELLEASVEASFYNGLILRECNLPMKYFALFYKQRYCKIYNIVGKTSPISFN